MFKQKIYTIDFNLLSFSEIRDAQKQAGIVMHLFTGAQTTDRLICESAPA